MARAPSSTSLPAATLRNHLGFICGGSSAAAKAPTVRRLLLGTFAWIIFPLIGSLARHRWGRRGLLATVGPLGLALELDERWNWLFSEDFLGMWQWATLAAAIAVIAILWWWPANRLGRAGLVALAVVVTFYICMTNTWVS